MKCAVFCFFLCSFLSFQNLQGKHKHNLKKIEASLFHGDVHFAPGPLHSCEQARQYYLLAYSLGSRFKEMFYRLGYIYYKGNGTAVDYQNAHFFFKLAANAGHEKALAYLEIMKRKGKDQFLVLKGNI